jgi:hypothetical protein
VNDAELIRRIFTLSRGDLDVTDVTLPAPEFGPELDRLHFVRLTRLSRSWGVNDRDAAGLLEQNGQRLIAGLSGPWMFLLKGSSRQLECWVGLATPEADLRALVAAAFPDARFGDGAFDRAGLTRFRHVAQLTGIPSRRSGRGAGAGPDPIERLCRGLTGGHWVYAVHAVPLARGETVAARNDLLEQIWKAHANYLHKGSAIGEQNRAARQYVELLEAQLRRHDDGRALGMWATQTILFADGPALLGRGRAALLGAYVSEAPVPEPVRTCVCTPGAAGEPYRAALTSAEAAALAHPPAEEFPGYELVEPVRFGVEPNANPRPGAAVQVGAVIDRGLDTGNRLTLPLGDLAKHALIVGVTGSGKTNTCFRLLEQAWDGGRGVPFLVVESAKSEYRALAHEPAFRGLKVFTVGDETTSPLRLNPFEVPPGVLVQTHLDYLKSLFAAAFVLYPPMPYVLEQGLREIYTDRGWDLARNTNRRGHGSTRSFPTLSDLVAKVRSVVERLGYDERITMDVKAGLVARLDQLRSGGGKGPMLDTRASVPAAVLFGSPCVLELKRLVDDDEKAFLIGLVLIRLYEFHEGGQGRSLPARDGLRHLTLIEEAHRLLRNVSTEQGGEVAANPKGRAIEVFANILSEVRAFGEGLLIAEQVPVKLVPDALKNTNLKVVHRLVAEDDRKAVGGTMNLGEAQTRALSTLRSGEAVAYTEGMQKPVLLAVPLTGTKHAGREVTDGDVRDGEAVRAFWREHPLLRLPFPDCKACRSTTPGTSCAGRTAERGDQAARRAFLRLFRSLWLGPENAAAAYDEFRAACLRRPGSSRDPHAAYCLFVELVNAEAEQRGAYWGWGHREVEPVIAWSCELAVLFEARHVRGAAADPRRVAQIRQELATLLAGLHKTDHRPFPGCSACPRPCSYRFDMARPAGHEDGARFRAACEIDDLETMQAELLETCWDAAEGVFEDEERPGAAVCFAAQQLDELPLADARQREITEWVAGTLTQK